MKPLRFAAIVCMILSIAPAILAANPATATSPGSWRGPGLIETDNAGSAADPQVAVDASGNAVAVWYQSDGARTNIWANRYVAGSGWATASLIETDNVGGATTPQVAVDASGNAVAVWSQYDGTRNNILANRYVAGSNWGTAALIETDNAGYAFAPQVAVDASGNAVAVWQQSDGATYNIWANQFVVGSGWGTAALIETDNAASAGSPQVAVDASGNAVAVWLQSDGTRLNIWANRYVAGSTWGTAALIETDTGDALAPQVAMDASGNAVAVWPQWDGTRYSVRTNRYAAGSGWGAAALIEADSGGNAAFAQVAVDPRGDAFAVWQEANGARYDIWANRYVIGRSWGTAALIETDNAGSATNAEVAVDVSGNAVAVWQQSDGTRFNMWADRYVLGSGWGRAALIETDNAGDAHSAQVAVDASGNAVAVWSQWDGTQAQDNIVANSLTEDYVPALVVASPLDKSTSDQPAVWVAGTTEPGARLTLSGWAAGVAPNGSFGVLVALQPGDNVIEATAWDAAGNNATVRVHVFYTDPVPRLEQQLVAAQADLAAAQANLAAANAELASAQARVEALERGANTTQADLLAARANVTAARDRIEALQAQQVALSASLNSTRADMAATNAALNATKANPQSSPGADSGLATIAIALGAIGIAVGAAGLAMAMRGRRSQPRTPQPPPSNP